MGGNTSCIAVTLAGHVRPTLLLDAGTGLSSVTRSLDGAPFSGDILLTHLHWDHVQGLPFFTAGDRDDAQVRLLLPAQREASPDRRGSAAALDVPHKGGRTFGFRVEADGESFAYIPATIPRRTALPG